MAESRGSILISTANEIGGSLVNKLGGDGYAPKDWSDNINLLGISEVDSEAAISALKESQGSGSRGSILISTANEIGATLNKKFSTERGFKPCEWASAISKMKALETDTKSGSMVNVLGAKEVPTLSLVGTINPNLDGVSSVSATRLGKNLWEFGDRTVDTVAYIMLYFSKPLPAGTYTISCNLISTTTTCSFRFRKEDGSYLEQTSFQANVGRVSKTLTISEPAYRVYIYSSTQGSGETTTWKDVQIEVGSEATEYTPYEEPTVYSADLGRTIYGGSADIVKGEGVENKKLASDFSTLRANGASSTGAYRYIIDFPGLADYNTGSCISNLLTYRVSYNANVGEFYNTSGTMIIFLSQSTVNEAIEYLTSNNCKIVYPIAETIPFTFEPIEVLTSGEVENFYTSAGDTSIEYYAAPTPYTRGTASGAIASFSGANTEFPFTKLKANIAPSVDGVSSVDVYNEESTVYSADLGETVYGGSVDLVSGEVKKTYKEITVGNSGWTYYESGSNSYLYKSLEDKVTPVVGDTNHALVCDMLPYGGVTYASQFADLHVYQAANKNVYIKDTSCSSASDYYEKYSNMKIGYELDTPIDSSIDGQVIFPNEGVNNVSNSAGGDTEVEYFIAE